MMIFEAGDVVVVSFRSTHVGAMMARPALVVSAHDFNQQGYSILAMITDARHPSRLLDTPIRHGSVGLKLDSVIRMKLFTVNNHQISGRLGDLDGADWQKFIQNLRKLLPSRMAR